MSILNYVKELKFLSMESTPLYDFYIFQFWNNRKHLERQYIEVTDNSDIFDSYTRYGILAILRKGSSVIDCNADKVPQSKVDLFNRVHTESRMSAYI